MHEIQASEAKTNLPRILTAVERGETIIITRHGRAIARLVPEEAAGHATLQKVKAEISKLRRDMPHLTMDDILDARHTGHKY